MSITVYNSCFIIHSFRYYQNNGDIGLDVTNGTDEIILGGKILNFMNNLYLKKTHNFI